MQKVLSILLALALPVAGSLYAQTTIGNIELEGSHLKVKAQIIGFQTSIQTSAEAATGMGIGKRQHTPITILRIADGSSPLLQQATTNGELLKTVTISIDKPSARKGGYLQIKLTNAMITGISLSAGAGNPNAQVPFTDPVEQISLTYQNIQFEYSDGKTVFKDDWTVGR